MASPLKPRPPRFGYHAVSIVSGPGACAQAKALKGVRLLSLSAPRLPIVGCTDPEGCHCKFEHHEDRRSGSRRSGMRSAIRDDWSMEGNRRRSSGRRDADSADK